MSAGTEGLPEAVCHGLTELAFIAEEALGKLCCAAWVDSWKHMRTLLSQCSGQRLAEIIAALDWLDSDTGRRSTVRGMLGGRFPDDDERVRIRHTIDAELFIRSVES